MKTNVNQIKIAGILLLIIAIVIVVLQNTEIVQLKILFITLTMPRAVLLISTSLFGFVIGVLFSFLWKRKKEEKKQVKETPAPAEQPKHTAPEPVQDPPTNTGEPEKPAF